MASSGGFQWTWSDEYQDYYYVTTDSHGQYVYNWAKQMPDATAGASQTLRPRGDSGTYQQPDTNVSHMPDSVPPEVRQQIPGLIPGTPERGWYEPLDSSFQMRTGSETYRFFKTGKVFAMLHTQAASEQAAKQGNDNISVVKYGEHVFSQIRRFIVVEVRRGFVYACPISTYSGRGTLKRGCIQSEHSIVYFTGTRPTQYQGENLTKAPIAINPADPGLTMHPASRLQYGKAYPVEMNVKVKDIGDVIPEDLSNLLAYYREENGLM